MNQTSSVFRALNYLFVIGLLTVMSHFADAQDARVWSQDKFQFRAPVQVKNGGDKAAQGQTVRLELPLKLLAKAGHLRADFGDVRLFNAQGRSIPLSISPASDKPADDTKTDAAKDALDVIIFNVPDIAAKERAIYYLYYGNADAMMEMIDETFMTAPSNLIVTAGAEETQGKVATVKNPANIDEWLKTHKAEEFTGQVWARVRVDEPKDYLYNVIVDSETNPYTPERFATGTISAYGLQPSGYEAGSHWGKPLPWIAPLDDTDWLRAGQYSAWVALPLSKAAYFHTAFIVRPKDEKMTQQPKLHIEFASRPSSEFIFHVSDEPTNSTATALVMMPTDGGEDGLRKLETFTEAARRRLATVQAMKLSPPPHLEKLRVNTWAAFGTYRVSGGNAALETVLPDFQIFEALGINMASVSGVSDAQFRELAKKYHLVDTTITDWAGMWPYSRGGYDGLYKWQDGETPEQHWKRVFDDYYGKQVESIKTNQPFAFDVSTHINLADEPGPATSVKEIRETPQILNAFREWLQLRGLQPSQLAGATDEEAKTKTWDDVFPTDDRKPLSERPDDIRYARLFYNTWRFIDYYGTIFYGSATRAVRKYYGDRKLIAVNYQAGPIQYAFIGNNNDTDKGLLDFFELSRAGALGGVMMEDWVGGWDLGVGRERLASEMMRSAARKHKLAMASYLVGGEAIRAELFAYLMSGIKENGLYLYGPVGNIGPAWADIPSALAETADVTRQLKKFENEIDKAQVRPTKAAMMISTVSDIMQAKGLYFAPERQDFYVALAHSYLPIDIVSEGDITQDDLLKNYSILYVTDPQVSTAAQGKIADWVKNGGRLWAQVGAANWNEFNQESTILNAAFGVKSRGWKTQDGGINPSAASWSANASKFNYQQVGTLKTSAAVFGGPVEMPVWGAKLTCEPTTAKVIGQYEDGAPAILENKYGKGEAILVGALVGQSYIQAHYSTEEWKDWKPLEKWSFDSGTPARQLATGLANRAGVLRPALLSTSGVYNAVMDTPNATLVLLNNATGRPLDKITVRVRDAGKVKRVESTRQNKVAFRLEKGEVVIETPLQNTDILCLYR